MLKLNTVHREKTKQDAWRNSFHIQPPTGLLNDPNGLIYHNGIYHVFYQWHPDAPIHGLKFWNHVTSPDLVHWEEDTRIIIPDTPYETHGAYSGSAFVLDDTIHLFYTGNTRNNKDERIPYQLKTTVTDTIGKKEPILTGQPDGYTPHFRDPKIFQREETYFMLIGAQRENLTGTALMYTSTNGHEWHFSYELTASFGPIGYMWECPDLITLDSQDVLIFCPQGAFDTSEQQENIYSNVYALGQFDYQSGYLDAICMKKLDYGFDFYASQTFQDENGDYVLLAWLGLPEIEYPTIAYEWANVLTIPRILSVKNNHLYQKPHPALQALRQKINTTFTRLSTYEMIIEGISKNITIHPYTLGTEKLILSYDMETQTLVLDRSQFTHTFGENFGTTRTVTLDEPLSSLHILRDTSTIEIFINDGKYTMSARFFPSEIPGNIQIESTEKELLEITLYELEEVTNDL